MVVEKISSSHDSIERSTYGFNVPSIGGFYNLVTKNAIEKNSVEISSSNPWHVPKSCSVVVDLTKLALVDDITYDCW